MGNKSEQKPKDLWKTIKRLAGYLGKDKKLILFSVLTAAAGAVMQVMTPKLLGNATTLIFESVKLQIGVDMGKLMGIIAVIGVCLLGTFTAAAIQGRIMTVLSQKTVARLRNRLKEKQNKLPVSYFDSHSNGSLMSVAGNDMDNILTNMEQSLTDFISNFVLVTGILGIMLTISIKLTFLALFMIPGSMAVMKLFSKKIQKNNRKYFDQFADLNGHVEEILKGFDVIKGFEQEENALEKFDSINEQMYEYGWRAKFFGGSMMPSMMLVQNTIFVLITVAGASLVTGGGILIGDLQAFLQYSTQFTNPIAKFSQIWGSALAAIASAQRVFEVLDAEETKRYNQKFPNKKHEQAKVAFENVQFGYNDELLMDEFNLEVKEGQMTAVVGETGAGKTTLLNLLERFYEIRNGSIRVDGRDIRNQEQSYIRNKIGMVLQDTWLFSGTIYDNIKYGNEGAAKEQVYAAAKASYADEFIQKLPDGYDTVLAEDAENLSQGEKQLLTIARAFVADPEILVLDEATSNVDSRTELVIQKAMKELMKGRTSFVAAHRLSTIYHADQIIVMQKGNVSEIGKHEELIEKGGVYADIYQSQFAGYAA